jgi:hypothetical protein
MNERGRVINPRIPDEHVLPHDFIVGSVCFRKQQKNI